MRYDINLMEGERHWASRITAALKRLPAILTSTAFIVSLAAAVALAGGFFAVSGRVGRIAPADRERVHQLQSLNRGYEEKREALIREAVVAFQMVREGPGWARRVRVIGGHVPREIRLGRIALETERPRSSGGRSQQKKRFLVIEGRVDARQNPSPLEPISRFLKGLNGDPDIQEVVHPIQLVFSQASQEAPFAVGFQLKGALRPYETREVIEKRVEQWLKTHAGAGRGS